MCDINEIQNRKLSGWLGLLVCFAAIGWIWLVWLPSVTESDTMQRIIQRHNEAGIDAGAMVYTELGEVAAVRFDYQQGKPVLRKFIINKSEIARKP